MLAAEIRHFTIAAVEAVEFRVVRVVAGDASSGPLRSSRSSQCVSEVNLPMRAQVSLYLDGEAAASDVGRQKCAAPVGMADHRARPGRTANHLVGMRIFRLNRLVHVDSSQVVAVAAIGLSGCSSVPEIARSCRQCRRKRRSPCRGDQ